MADYDPASAPETGSQAAGAAQAAQQSAPAGGDPGPGTEQVHPGTIFQGAGFVMDPATGQLFYKVPVQPGAMAYGPGVQPGFQPGIQPGIQPDMAGMAGPGFDPAMSAGTVPPGAVPPGAAQQEVPPAGPDYGEVIKSVEQFAEGEATVGDVVKTLYTNTAQDDQFWKGALVGAAAAVLLTSGPVKETMGKTFGGLFGAAAGSKAADGEKTAADSPTPEDKKE